MINSKLKLIRITEIEIINLIDSGVYNDVLIKYTQLIEDSQCLSEKNYITFSSSKEFSLLFLANDFLFLSENI